MKIIPSHLWDDKKDENEGEQRFFELIKDVSLSGRDIALHSLNLAGDKKQQWYELDFLLLTQKYVIGVEVKSGYLSPSNGEWRVHRSDMSVRYSKRKSPYIQAKDATLAWRQRWLERAFPEASGKLGFVYLVALLQNDKDSVEKMHCPELPREVVLDADSFSIEGLVRALNKTIVYHTYDSGRSEPVGISKEQVEFISAKLRPTLDKTFPRSVAKFLMSSQNQLTEGQYSLVDVVEFAERAIVEGGAGTGKTFVLAYLAEKERLSGSQVLVLVSPRLLKTMLSDLLSKENVTVINPDELGQLPSNKFDCLFVDEGQDLCKEEVFNQLDNVLKLGLAGGHWRWFGDFSNQLAEGIVFDSEMYSFLKEMTSGSNAVIQLNKNVRNTPNIVKWLEGVCKARVGQTEMVGAGPVVQIVKPEKFGDALDGLDEGFRIPDENCYGAVVICPDKYRDTFSQSPTFRLSTEEAIPAFTADEFKGLESQVVFVWTTENLTDSELSDFCYKAVSRARAICIILANRLVNEQILELVQRARE